MPPTPVQSTSQGFSNASSVSFSHNAGSGSNRAVFVSVMWWSTPNITAITYGGVAMTLVDSRSQNVGEIARIATYVLVNPASGAQTVSVTFSAATYGSVGADSWTDVNQSSPTGAVTYGGSASGPPSLQITGTTAGNIVRAAAWLYFAGWSYTYGQTGLWLCQGGRWGSAEYTAAGGSKTMTWVNDSTPWTMHIFEINAAPSPPSNSVAPAITGTVQVGQVLTCSDGTWTGSPTSHSKQWQRADDSGFTTNVTNVGTDSSTFTPTASELGKYIRCTDTATNTGGSTAANSNVVGPVSAAASTAPSNSVAPSCSPASGGPVTSFTFSSGTWTGSPTGWSWEYQSASGGSWTQFSTLQNPTVTGSTFGAGTWNTRLTATNAGGSATANGTQITVAAAQSASRSLTLTGVG